MYLILVLSRVTLIVGLPPRLTSFWIISSQILLQISSNCVSNSPFPPSLAGRLEQLLSPWFALCSWKRNNVTHLWVGLSLGLKLLQSFWSYRYQIYLVLILFLFNSQISNNGRGYKIKTSWLLCSVLSPNANTSPFPIVYPPITRKTIDNFFFSNLTALLQAMYFGKIQSSKFYFSWEPIFC